MQIYDYEHVKVRLHPKFRVTSNSNIKELKMKLLRYNGNDIVTFVQ